MSEQRLRDRRVRWFALGIISLVVALHASGYGQVAVGVLVGIFLGALFTATLLRTIPRDKIRL